MLEFLYTIAPNLAKNGIVDELIKCTIDTLLMTGIAGFFAFFFGIFFGVILIVTKKGGIMECSPIYKILEGIINLFRSIPFLILTILLIDISRWILGVGIGVKGAVIPLIVGTTPFFARQIESALSEVDHGLIEASQAMGCSNFEIITRVYLKESVPSIIRGLSITLINLVGLTAISGAVGAGGLGDFAIRYGHQMQMKDLMWITIIIIVIIVSIIQVIGNTLVKKTSH